VRRFPLVFGRASGTQSKVKARDMAKHNHEKLKPGQLDCEEIGCSPKLSQTELENGEGFWLLYEKSSGAKLIKFTIKLSDTSIDYAEWVDGSKTKWQKRTVSSPQLARQEFTQLIESKKASGFSFVGWKW